MFVFLEIFNGKRIPNLLARKFTKSMLNWNKI